MGSIRKRVTPELIQSTLHRPSRGGAVAQVEVRGRIADERRLRAAATREAVLEPARGQQLGQYAIGAVELADLAEWPVGDEVHGILAIANRKVDRETTRRVRRIVGDEIAAPV